MLMTGSGRHADRVTTPFYLQPDWPEVESMVSAPTPAAGPESLLLMRDPEKTMYQFVDQVASVVEVAARAMMDLWDADARTQHFSFSQAPSGRPCSTGAN